MISKTYAKNAGADPEQTRSRPGADPEQSRSGSELRVEEGLAGILNMSKQRERRERGKTQNGVLE